MTHWLEQALCPHEHHRGPDGIVRCCMCGHVTNKKRTRVRSRTVYCVALAFIIIPIAVSLAIFG
ncbi:hypothetical protein PU634_04875 [Oceanimonas pelagia]|uniref:Uncharacterized protein n=1 Tax=Oceanimonas pelagia TaxID=3028314 RepID=A0AA50KPN3_9GAMM|nr:hypothetical protein [Oceanimonas pelagia]WMC11700.1 hypothetical protein PU634_04875 [Oceanimonas pelagia]